MAMILRLGLVISALSMASGHAFASDFVEALLECLKKDRIDFLEPFLATRAEYSKGREMGSWVGQDKPPDDTAASVSWEHRVAERASNELSQVRNYGSLFGFNWEKATLDRVTTELPTMDVPLVEFNAQLHPDAGIITLSLHDDANRTITVFASRVRNQKGARLNGQFLATTMTLEERNALRKWHVGHDAKTDEEIGKVILRTRAAESFLHGKLGTGFNETVVQLPARYDPDKRDIVVVTWDGISHSNRYCYETGIDTFVFEGNLIQVLDFIPTNPIITNPVKIEVPKKLDISQCESWEGTINGHKREFFKVRGKVRTYRAASQTTKIVADKSAKQPDGKPVFDHGFEVDFADGFATAVRIGDKVLRSDNERPK